MKFIVCTLLQVSQVTTQRPQSLFPEEQEEFNPNKEVAQFVEAIKKFIKDQELPDEEERPTLNKLVRSFLFKMIYFKFQQLHGANNGNLRIQIPISDS